MAKQKVTREQMEALATQMNEGVVIGDGTTVKFEPPIDFAKKVSDTKLRKALEAELPDVQDDDKFSEENWVTINLLRGLSPVAAEKEEVVEEPADEKKEEKAAAEKPEKKAPVAKKAAAKPADKAPTKSAKKSTERASYTRSQALAEALKAGPGTKKEIVALSDELYMKNAGGKSNHVVSEAMYRYGVPLLKLLGVAEENKGVVELVVK